MTNERQSSAMVTKMADSERVLFVDDDPLIRSAFARSMRQTGFIVDVAESGDEALHLTEHYPYAVLVADWRMPGLDGVKLAAAVRRGGIEPGFILVTGAAAEELAEIDTAALGISAVVRKPWVHTEMVAAISDALADFQERCEGVRASTRVPVGERRVMLVAAEGSAAAVALRALHQSAGYQVKRVAHLAECLDVLGREVFDALILDGADASESSMDVLRRVSAVHAALPVIVLAEVENDGESLALIQAGAQDYVTLQDAYSGQLPRSIARAIERKRIETRLAHLANHDQLTELGNRALLSERLHCAVSRARRNGSYVGVFYLDLDRFKAINDTLGHDAGDLLLRQVAARIRGSVRDTDTVARLGGDEFAVVLDGLERPEGVTLLAQRILNSFATPFRLGTDEVVTSTSIGIAMYPHNGDDTEGLLKAADTAMYRAKTTGRNNYQFFSEALHAQSIRQVRLEQDVRLAAADQDFLVYFQPQVRLTDYQVVGVEALLRWRRPNGVWVPPSEFVPVLEATGEIVAVGERILRKLCAQLTAWNASGPVRLRGSINIGARQFESPQFVGTVARAISDYGLGAQQLEIELNERVLMPDPERARVTLSELRKVGVRVVLDDFGTGYSALTHLKRFTVDAIKIDTSLVHNFGKGERDEELACAVIGLARSFRLDVIAEGVETQAQFGYLRREHCTMAQGYYIGRPADARQTTRWLRKLSHGGSCWAEPEMMAAAASPLVA